MNPASVPDLLRFVDEARAVIVWRLFLAMSLLAERYACPECHPPGGEFATGEGDACLAHWDESELDRERALDKQIDEFRYRSLEGRDR